MIDFGALTYERQKNRTNAVTQAAPVSVTQTVQVTRAEPKAASYLLKQSAQWTWKDLRDYVMAEVEKVVGLEKRNAAKEAGIFKGFIARHGTEDAVTIARAAFQLYNGMWRNAPIRVERFCANSDPYFAEPILARVQPKE